MDTIPSRVKTQDFVIFAGVAIVALVAITVYFLCSVRCIECKAVYM